VPLELQHTFQMPLYSHYEGHLETNGYVVFVNNVTGLLPFFFFAHDWTYHLQASTAENYIYEISLRVGSDNTHFTSNVIIVVGALVVL
jgi:hypothetical protein